MDKSTFIELNRIAEGRMREVNYAVGMIVSFVGVLVLSILPVADEVTGYMKIVALISLIVMLIGCIVGQARNSRDRSRCIERILAMLPESDATPNEDVPVVD